MLENGVGSNGGFTGGLFTQVSAGGGNLLVDLNFDGSDPIVGESGTLSFVLPGNFGDLRSFLNGQTAAYEYDTNGGGSPEFTGELNAIPEPSAALMLVGLGACVFLQRRKR